MNHVSSFSQATLSNPPYWIGRAVKTIERTGVTYYMLFKFHHLWLHFQQLSSYSRYIWSSLEIPWLRSLRRVKMPFEIRHFVETIFLLRKDRSTHSMSIISMICTQTQSRYRGGTGRRKQFGRLRFNVPTFFRLAGQKMINCACSASSACTHLVTCRTFCFSFIHEKTFDAYCLILDANPFIQWFLCIAQDATYLRTGAFYPSRVLYKSRTRIFNLLYTDLIVDWIEQLCARLN